jgi:hypothetical protein
VTSPRPRREINHHCAQQEHADGADICCVIVKYRTPHPNTMQNEDGAEAFPLLRGRSVRRCDAAAGHGFARLRLSSRANGAKNRTIFQIPE